MLKASLGLVGSVEGGVVVVVVVVVVFPALV
jgi:hypothetical protein